MGPVAVAVQDGKHRVCGGVRCATDALSSKRACHDTLTSNITEHPQGLDSAAAGQSMLMLQRPSNAAEARQCSLPASAAGL